MDRRHSRGGCALAALFAAMLMVPGIATAAGEDDAEPRVAQAEPVPPAEEGAAQERRDELQRQEVEEIVVTSRKRDEVLQDVPIAITAFSELDLKDQQIRRLEDVMKTVPNFMMDNAVGGSQSAARSYMRGVGNGNPGLRDENGVGIYIDGVYQPRSVGQILAVSDIERIEVLRGPQGTLYGKNTIGGAVNIITAKPGTDFGGYGEIRAGNFSQFDTRFAMNVPVTEAFRTRFSFATRTSDGWTKSTLSHNDFNDDRLLAARASFAWDLTESLGALLTIDGAKERRGTRAAKCALQPGYREIVAQIQAGVPAAERGGSPANAQPEATFQLFRPTTSFPTTLQDACAADENAIDEHRVAEANLLPGGRFDTGQFDDIRTFGSTFTLSWDLTDTLSLQSRTGWHGYHQSGRAALDGTIFSIIGDMPGETDKTDHNTYSQELLLTGSALQDRLDFTLGLYWFSEENTSNSKNLTLPDLELVQDDPNTFPDGFEGGRFIDTQKCLIASNLCAGFFELGGGKLPSFWLGVQSGNEASYAHWLREFILKPSETHFWTANKNYALFTELSFDVTERLSLTAGVRYSHERRRIRNESFRRNSVHQFADIDYTAHFDPEIEAMLRADLDPDEAARMSGFRILSQKTIINGAFEACIAEDGQACVGQLTATPRERSARWSAWTPAFTLKYDLTDDTNVYVRWARGWKSGLLDARPFPLLDADGNAAILPTGAIEQETVEFPVEPEKLSAWELGVKSSFFENRLRLNLAYFRSLWEDAQLTLVTTDINGNVTAIDENAASAIIHGFELEARALPAPGLTLSASLGMAAARYREFEACSPVPAVFPIPAGAASVPIRLECSGFEVPPSTGIPSGPFSNNDLPGTPTYQYTFSASYVFPLLGWGDLRTRLQWAAETGRAADILDPHFTRSPKHGTLDGRLALELSDGRTELVLWGTNLLNRKYFTNAINVASVASLLGYAPPRRYGFEIRREFGAY